MTKVFKTPFGALGDKQEVPVPTQTDGSVSYEQGFGVDYQRDYEDPQAKDIPREGLNQLFYDVTNALGQVQVQGSATWSPDGAPYPVNAQVYHNGKQWFALRANSVEPAEGEDWSQLGTAATKNVGESAGTVAAGNDTRIVNAVPNSRTITAGTGLSGGGNLTANRTLSIASSHTPIGAGQTWQDVAGSRSVETTYTNTTGRPIAVSIVGSVSSTRRLLLYVNSIAVGKTLETANNSPENQLFTIIPAGSTYYASWDGASAGTLISWVELR